MSNSKAINPIEVTVPVFRIVGITAEIDPGAGSEIAMSKIGKLWQTFYSETLSTIPNQVTPPKVLGVYSSYASDYRGKYQLSPSCEVSSFDCIPANLYRSDVPEQKYLRFQATGEQPASVMKAWSEIWNYFADPSRGKRKYTVDFEHYKSHDLVEIFIAVE